MFPGRASIYLSPLRKCRLEAAGLRQRLVVVGSKARNWSKGDGSMADEDIHQYARMYTEQSGLSNGRNKNPSHFDRGSDSAPVHRHARPLLWHMRGPDAAPFQMQAALPDMEPAITRMAWD